MFLRRLMQEGILPITFFDKDGTGGNTNDNTEDDDTGEDVDLSDEEGKIPKKKFNKIYKAKKDLERANKDLEDKIAALEESQVKTNNLLEGLRKEEKPTEDDKTKTLDKPKEDTQFLIAKTLLIRDTKDEVLKGYIENANTQEQLNLIQGLSGDINKSTEAIIEEAANKKAKILFDQMKIKEETPEDKKKKSATANLSKLFGRDLSKF